MTLAWHTTFSCWPFPRLWLLAPASWIFARPSLPEAPARARRPAGERRRAEGNEPAPQKRRPPGNKRTTKTKIEREPRAISERRRRFCSPCGRAIFWFVCCDGYISRRPGGRSLSVLSCIWSRALAGSFARAGCFALGARKLHPARITFKRTSRAAADEPARQKRRRSGGEAVHARRSFERRRRWSSLHSEFFL